MWNAGPSDPRLPRDVGPHQVDVLECGRGRGGLFFGSGETPFREDTVRSQAIKSWKAKKLTRLGFHEARHTYASIQIAAGVNAKALSTYMGHSSITITLDRYGHLMPGNENEAVALVDAYIENATGARTGAQAALFPQPSQNG